MSVNTFIENNQMRHLSSIVGKNVFFFRDPFFWGRNFRIWRRIFPTKLPSCSRSFVRSFLKLPLKMKTKKTKSAKSGNRQNQQSHLPSCSRMFVRSFLKLLLTLISCPPDFEILKFEICYFWNYLLLNSLALLISKFWNL